MCYLNADCKAPNSYTKIVHCHVSYPYNNFQTALPLITENCKKKIVKCVITVTSGGQNFNESP